MKMYTPSEVEFLDIGGVQHIYNFENSRYSASVIQSTFSYGGKQGDWELAMRHDGELCYSTPVTGDVLGWLTQEQVQEKLRFIEFLIGASLIF